MKTIKQTLLTLVLTLWSISATAADKTAKTKEIAKPATNTASKVQAGKYALDTAHSKVGFEIPHLVISTVEGRFKTFDGEIELAEKFSESKVIASIDTNSIDTANGDRDKHLQSADFFDSAKYPKMTFKSKKITGTISDFQLIGDLTIKEKTKEVIFKGKFLGNVTDAYGNTKAAFQASTEINRQDFGLTWGKLVEAGPVVGDKVTINLKIQGTQAK